METVDISANVPVFSEIEWQKLDLIKGAEEFGKTLGLKETSNFKDFVETDPKLYRFFVCLKNSVPFSLLDPKIKQLELSEKEEFLKNHPNHSDYVFETIVYNAYAGGSITTRKLLALSDDELVGVVVHEKFHDSVGMPLHMDEAAAMLVGISATALFVGGDQEMVKERLKEHLDEEVTRCLNLWEGLNKTIDKDKKGLSKNQERMRRIGFGLSGYKNVIDFASCLTYNHYFPLMFDLFRHFNFELPKFIEFCKNFPRKEDHSEDAREHFHETRKREFAAERIIRNMIGGANK